jgi:hypothetical protein
VTPYDQREAHSADPAAVSMPPHTSIDITAYLPPADSEPTA